MVLATDMGVGNMGEESHIGYGNKMPYGYTPIRGNMGGFYHIGTLPYHREMGEYPHMTELHKSHTDRIWEPTALTQLRVPPIWSTIWVELVCSGG